MTWQGWARSRNADGCSRPAYSDNANHRFPYSFLQRPSAHRHNAAGRWTSMSNNGTHGLVLWSRLRRAGRRVLAAVPDTRDSWWPETSPLRRETVRPCRASALRSLVLTALNTSCRRIRHTRVLRPLQTTAPPAAWRCSPPISFRTARDIRLQDRACRQQATRDRSPARTRPTRRLRLSTDPDCPGSKNRTLDRTQGRHGLFLLS